jgi:hypothetical protein
MSPGKSLQFLSRVLALINVGFEKINLTVVCRIDERKSLKVGSYVRRLYMCPWLHFIRN